MYSTTRTPARAWRAHALKNCIAVIHAVNKLIERDLSDVSRQRIERSQQALQRMLFMLSDDLAQAGTCRDGDCTLARVEDVLSCVLAGVEDVAEARGVELFVQAGPGDVSGDITALSEALCNIVLNAVQATAAGGAVLIATYERPDGSQLWVVQDTGCGMPEDLVARLGTPRLSRRPGGSGLGLASAIEAVERHSGVVRIESKVGSGTIVSIMLPSAVPATAPSSEFGAPPSARADEGATLADDIVMARDANLPEAEPSRFA